MRIADIEVRDREDNVVLVAEVKSRRKKDARWAAELRRNLLSHGQSMGRYLLLVTPENSYLWRNDDGVLAELRDPDRIANTRALLGSRLGEAIDRADLSSTALEHLVAAWLSSVVHSSSPNDVPAPLKGFLLETGLYDALRETNVRVA